MIINEDYDETLKYVIACSVLNNDCLDCSDSLECAYQMDRLLNANLRRVSYPPEVFMLYDFS